METMSEKTDRLRGEPGTPGVNASASYTAAAASSIDTTSAAEAETDGSSNPAPAGEAAEGYLPHTNFHALCACIGDRPRANRTSLW